MKQKVIAEAVGISAAHYSTIRSGKTPIGRSTAEKIGNLLGIDWYDVYRLSIGDLHDQLSTRVKEQSND